MESNILPQKICDYRKTPATIVREGEHLHEHSPLPDHPVGLWLRMLQLLDGVAELGQAAREHVCSSSGNAERNDARKVDGRGH